MKHLLLVSLLTATFCFTLGGGTPLAAEYVGSANCFECHEEQFNDWQASGHPWKLRKVEKAKYSGLPLPPGYRWEDVSYVIGGANKKARFIDKKGYIITKAKDGSEAKTQYNLADGSWSFYHKGEENKDQYRKKRIHRLYCRLGQAYSRSKVLGLGTHAGAGCKFLSSHCKEQYH